MDKIESFWYEMAGLDAYLKCNTQARREYKIIKAMTPTTTEIMTDCLGSALPELRTTLVQINTPTPSAKTAAI
jgi:hypothetical protein